MYYFLTYVYSIRWNINIFIVDISITCVNFCVKSIFFISAIDFVHIYSNRLKETRS